MTAVTSYESRLNANPEWALREGSMHFEQESGVQVTLKNITRRFEELGIPYAVAGGMALFFHGFRRFTEDVDILISKESLERVHSALDGLGYLPPFEGSKNLRDTKTGVRIEFLLAGEYPGDGKPKPVVFPEPSSASVELSGVLACCSRWVRRHD